MTDFGHILQAKKLAADDSQVLQYLRIVGGGWIDRMMLLMFYKTLKAWHVNFGLMRQNLTVARMLWAFYDDNK